MNPVTVPDVLTLEEASGYLRLSTETVERSAQQGKIPGRCLDGAWVFSKARLDAWRSQHDQRQVLMRQFGVLSPDDPMPEILAKIYEERGRPEVDDRID